VKIADLSAARLQIHLSSEDWWVVPGPTSVTELKPETTPIFLLPILELDHSAAKDALKDGFVDAGLSEDLLLRFPFEEVVTTGRNSFSEQWINLALGQSRELA